MLVQPGSGYDKRSGSLDGTLAQLLRRRWSGKVYHDITLLQQGIHTVGHQNIFGEIAFQFVENMHRRESERIILQNIFYQMLSHPSRRADYSDIYHLAFS
jgi:hypothetical protein